MPKGKPKVSIPTVRFTWNLEVNTHGIRVRWQSVRDTLHHPESFEVVASGEGVRLCGHSPALDEVATDRLACILGAAWGAVEMIREGLPPHTIKSVIEQSEKEYATQPEVESCQSN